MAKAKKRTFEYWAERFAQMERSQHNIAAESYAEIEQQYRQAQREIEGQIVRWYERLADNNEISITAAKRLLKADELKEFKWDVNDYIKYGQENALNQKWMKELENASAKVHISELEAMKVQMQQGIEALYGRQSRTINKAIKNVYENGYYHTIYEIQKGIGIGTTFTGLNDTLISEVINKPWAADGSNFSDRIWKNKDKLVAELNQTLTQNIILGQDPQKAIDKIAKKLNVSKVSAGRLVMTEEAFFSNAAQRAAFKELDVKEFEIVATLDSRTSKICQDMDGKHFPMSQWEVGVTAPPFHVNCRSCTCPYFDDEFTADEKRAAYDEEIGKEYQVPADMTYKEWKEKYVDGKKIEGLKAPTIKDAAIRESNEEFTKILEKGEPTKHINKMLLYNEATEYELNNKLEEPFAYIIEKDVIQYNPETPNFNSYDMNYVMAHELSHRMDIKEYESFKNEKFLKAIENSKKILDNNREEIALWFTEKGKYEENFAVSDIVSALSNNTIKLKIGHEKEYWAADKDNVPLEIFANISAIDVLGYSELNDIKNMFPELIEAYKEVVK